MSATRSPLTDSDRELRISGVGARTTRNSIALGRSAGSGSTSDAARSDIQRNVMPNASFSAACQPSPSGKESNSRRTELAV